MLSHGHEATHFWQAFCSLTDICIKMLHIMHMWDRQDEKYSSNICTLNHLSSLNGYFEITIFWMTEDLIRSQKCAFWKVFPGQANYWKRRQAAKDVPLLQASKRQNAWVWFHIMCDYSPKSFIICSASESFPSYYVIKRWGIEKLTTVKTVFSYGRVHWLRACILDSFLLLILESTEGYAFLFR